MQTPQPWLESKMRRRYTRRLALAAGATATALMLSFAGTAHATSAQATAATAAKSLNAASPTPPACPDGSGQTPLYRDTSYSFAERAADLVSCMTLAEKVGQLMSNSAPAIPRLGVQQYTYWSEGQHGINTMFADTNNGGVTGGVHATSFPVNLASTMSWDPQLVYQETTAISDEARGFLDKSLWGTGQNNLGPSANDYGMLTYWAPTVNMDRDPRWGRTDEGFGEDPYLASQMSDAFVEGYQGETMSGQLMTPYLKVAATAKHFALNNNENNRHADSSNTTDANIRDYYTAQFKSLTENAHVAGVMTSYNAINGTPAPADTYTVNELLQRTYGFNGYTTSDCGAIGDIYSAGSHDWAPPGWTTSTAANGTVVWTNNTTGQQLSGAAGGQAYALRAGTQVNCTGGEPTLANIQAAISTGALSVGVLDNALVHLFTMRMETGEFDPPSQVSYTQITKAAIQSPAHQALAEQVAAEDLVLLKNDNVSGTTSPLLPADPTKLNNVVIVGNLANTTTLGDYSGDPSLQVNAVQGITAAVKAANPNATVTYDSCGTSTTSSASASCSAATLAAIKSADLVIVFVGTDLNVATEQLDRTTLAMPGNYNSLISQVAAVGNPRTAMVIQSDGPVDISATQGDFPAIVFSAYNGESQGTALAQVLFGQVNPSGHLDFTWYANDSQLPGIKNYGLTPGQTGGLGRTYMYFTQTPSYPFGYGLSYAKFSYSHINIASRTVDANATVPVSFQVTNTGTVPGATVAQVYVAPQFTVPGVELPKEQLVAFQRTGVLAPGQTQDFTLDVKLADLSEWDQSSLEQVVYNGPYQFQVGSDSATVLGSGTITVTGAVAQQVQYVTVQPDQVIFKPGDTLDLTGKNPWIAPDTNPSLEQPHAAADNIVEAVNNNESFVDLSKASVSYASSDPAVATVSSSGMVTAVGHGVTTISVTVNGVTGTTPVVVQQPLTITTPAIVTPGTTAQVTTAIPDTSSQPLTNVSVSLEVPSGWTATATSPSTFASVQPGQTAKTSWDVTVPADATPGTEDITAFASFTDANGPGTTTQAGEVSVPYPSLADAFNNTAITDDTNVAPGNLDGGGQSLSAQALAAVGLTPGQTVLHDGIAFTWPSAASGTPDNVAAEGQTITLPGAGSALGFLGTGDYGTVSGPGTITYTDGTTQPYTLTFSDWYSNSAAPGGDILATTAYINNQSGRNNQRVSIYYAAVPLQAGKTVKYVTLPDIGPVASGAPAMHIFAVGYGCCSLDATAPSTVSPGQTVTARTVLTNNGGAAVTNAAVSLAAPSGWTATASGPANESSLGAGQNMAVTWSVGVPASAACGAYQLEATATFTDSSGNTISLPHNITVEIPCPSLSAGFNNVAITADSATSAGNIDGGGSSYSADGFAAAGLTPGSSVTVGGVALTWPNVPAGQPDNVVAEGQIIDMSGSGSSLVFLGAGDYGTVTGAGTITYTDGTTQSFNLTFADWYADAPQSGGTLVATTHLNSASGPQTHQVGVYSATFQLASGMTVASVTLPAISNGVAVGTPAMHIFAIGIG
jgi:beta-glucosidase